MIITPIRGQDCHGAGYYGAPRGGRVHKGVDCACHPGSIVLGLTHGEVTKIGYPYNPNDEKKGHCRYVEVTLDGNRFRYFYLTPLVSVGDTVAPLEPLGKVQDLTIIYPGITSHYHFEIIDANGEYINPASMFPEFD